MDSNGWPTRDEVREKWHAILEGTLSRESVHEWTVPWVEGPGPAWPPDDVRVDDALLNLHGFTMASKPETPNLVHHGPPGVYLKTPADIRADLERWELRNVEYDRDPVGWQAKQLAISRAYADQERRRRESQA